MTQQDDITQRVLTDDEIRAVWVEHGLDDEAVEDFARAIESALLSKLRAPVADERATDLFRSALAWGMTYGPVLNQEQWDEMREKMAQQFSEKLSVAPVADTRLRGLVQEAITWIESGGGPAVSLCADLRAALAPAPVADERAALEYGSPADVAQRIEQYLAQDGRMNSGTQLLYEAMKALRASQGDRNDG